MDITPQNQKEHYGFFGKFITKPGKGAELSAILMKAATAMKNVKGCRLYTVSYDPFDADAIYVFEAWDSKEDHDNALKVENVRELIAKAMPLIEGKSDGKNLQVLGGHGLEDI